MCFILKISRKSGETSLDAMKRELKEEIGIDVGNSDLKFVKTLKRDRVLKDCYIFGMPMVMNHWHSL